MDHLRDQVGHFSSSKTHRARKGGTFFDDQMGHFSMIKTQEPGQVVHFSMIKWVTFRLTNILEDKQAVSLELMFLTREPEEAFAVFDETGWNAWLDFFWSIRNREGNGKA